MIQEVWKKVVVITEEKTDAHQPVFPEITLLESCKWNVNSDNYFKICNMLITAKKLLLAKEWEMILPATTNEWLHKLRFIIKLEKLSARGKPTLFN